MEKSLSRTAHLLPTGGTLTRRQWGKRHAALTWVLAAHLPVLLLLGLARPGRPAHLLAELLVPVLALAAAGSRRLPDRLRACGAALGLALCSALLVHLTGGSIEAHFHFFVVVSAVAFYQQWSVLLLTVTFTVLHHVGLSALDPALVFDHGDAERRWPFWSLLHGLAITAQCAVALAHWRTHERALEAERRLARQLVEREAALQQALRRAEVDALAGGVAHGLNTPVQYAADNARYLGSTLLELAELTADTGAALDALPDGPCQCAALLQPLHDRHDQHGSDWDDDEVHRALADCLAGLEAVSRLALDLQETTAAGTGGPLLPARATTTPTATTAGDVGP